MSSVFVLDSSVTLTWYQFEQTPPERALGDVRGLAVGVGLSA